MRKLSLVALTWTALISLRLSEKRTIQVEAFHTSRSSVSLAVSRRIHLWKPVNKCQVPISSSSLIRRNSFIIGGGLKKHSHIRNRSWRRSATASDDARVAAATRSSSSSSSSSSSNSSRSKRSSISNAVWSMTPEGMGFTSTVGRILQETSERSPGYYRARASDSVLSVQTAISGGKWDVALVFEDDDPSQLVGLFTESDFIQFSIQRSQQATSEQDSAAYLMSAVRAHVTPADQLIALSTNEAVHNAMTRMNQNGVRHMVVADRVTSNHRLILHHGTNDALPHPSNSSSNSITNHNSNIMNGAESEIVGVVSMQHVMNMLQKDERISLTTLTEKYPNLSLTEQIRLELLESANEAAQDDKVAKQDTIRFATAALFGATVLGFASQSVWLHEHASLAMIGIFVVGYIGIIFEEVCEFNKAGVALLMSTALWITYGDFFGNSNGKASEAVLDQLGEQLAEVSDICFFLLAASAIVEVVDAHQGFKAVTNRISTTSKKELFWIVGFFTFFLSSILNNLTVTIVMVSLLRKLIPNVEDRKLFGAMVVVAANAGGVWTPIGDVTTTMLWINHQLSTIPTITELFLPSVVCLVASLAFLVSQVDEDGSLEAVAQQQQQQGMQGMQEIRGIVIDSSTAIATTTTPTSTTSPVSQRGQIVFWTGIASLLSVPVFNELTGLPPYLAMLTGLGVIWTLTDIIHVGEQEDEGLKVPAALARLDTSGILFFLGILMSIGVLDKSGLLKQLAVFLSNHLPSLDIIATVIGLASALIDNVPLVAATMGMYDLTEFTTDDKLWQLIALCAGTGGSILVIGSASGVALMGLEKVDFLWYAKKVSIGATVGYFAGIATYLAQYALLQGEILGGSLFPSAAVAADLFQQVITSTTS